MTDLNSAKEKIERLVQNKKASLASAHIQKFYKLYGHKTEILFICCDWYRRLGHYQKGIALLRINSNNLKIALSTSDKEGRKILWFSRLSNLLGAPTIAQRLIAKISAKSPEDHRIFGLIHLTNFSYAMAYASFLKVVGDKPAFKTYQERMDLLNFTDSLVGVQKFAEALKLNQQLLDHSESDFETALLNQAVGETYCAMEKWDQALVHLKKSEQFHTKKSTNIDLAFLQKWIALCHYRLGFVVKSHSYIGKSVDSLVKLSVKEDALLLSLDFAAQFDYLTTNQKFKLKMIKSVFYDHETCFAEQDQIGSDSALIKINWCSKEVLIKSGNNISYGFKLNKEVYLIVLLKLFEDWGINYYRIYDLIYGDNPFGVINAKDRIKALLQRLKKIYGLKTAAKGDRIFIEKSSAQKIQIKNLDSQPQFSFLADHSKHKPFKTKEVMEFYLISRSHALKLIQQWKSLQLC